jgi:DNA-binding transcriptional regulator YdaS (Cro superfamily)
MNKHPIYRAAEKVGGITALAELLGVSRQSIYDWIEKQVPAERCPTIERLTDGVVRCEELRDDIEWSVLRRRK